ncbi:MAG: MerR family transcriptional regulator, partial [Culicoidibacterales bacterium]
MYTISEVADKVGLTTHTLRYYEKEGLLLPKRDKNDRRVYNNNNHIQLLQFITKMRNSHMPLAKIKMYMILYHQGDDTISGRRQLLKEHYEIIKKEIEDL